MNNNAKRIVERLNALTLKILTPLDLTEAQLDALTLPHRNLKNPLFRNLFYLPIADFKQAAHDQVYQWAKDKETVYAYFPKEFYDDEASDDEHPFVAKQAKLYKSDITKILMALFECSERELTTAAICMAGFFDSPLSSRLHYDTLEKYSKDAEGQRIPIGCMSRLVGLNLQMISSAKRRFVLKGRPSFIEDKTNHVHIVRGVGCQQREQLRKRGILEALPLGRVFMVLGGRHGTWHCSSEGAGPSAFYYTAAGLPIRAAHL
jgi:hypothetical protein